MIRMTRIKRLGGRPQIMPDGLKKYNEVMESIEIPDVFYDLLDGLCTVHGWRWEDPAITVLRSPENAVKWHQMPDSEGLELPDDAEVKVGDPVRIPTLASPEFDPFNKWKTDPQHYYYRGLSMREKNINKRKAMGYEIVSPDATHGTLILGRLPREIKEARDKANVTKAESQSKSVAEHYQENLRHQSIGQVDRSK